MHNALLVACLFLALLLTCRTVMRDGTRNSWGLGRLFNNCIISSVFTGATEGHVLRLKGLALPPGKPGFESQLRGALGMTLDISLNLFLESHDPIRARRNSQASGGSGPTEHGIGLGFRGGPCSCCASFL